MGPNGKGDSSEAIFQGIDQNKNLIFEIAKKLFLFDPDNFRFLNHQLVSFRFAKRHTLFSSNKLFLDISRKYCTFGRLLIIESMDLCCCFWFGQFEGDDV